jgi:hypothetical protein
MLLTAVAAFALAACGGGDEVQSDAERFCGEAAAQRDMIIAPPLGTEAELQATLAFYRLMGQLAPVAIADEWNVLVVNLETASALIPGDEDSEQLVAMQAYASERSAYEVSEWLRRNCGVDLPITTIAPQGDVPALVPTTIATDGSTPVATGATD